VDGVMKMDDFDELEKEIAGDWLAIQKKIKSEELREKEINNPKRLHCSYKDFYKAIYNVAHNGMESVENLNELHAILRMVLSGSGRSPEGFEKIWDAFCESYRHDVGTIECMNCGEKYDILYKRTRPVVSYDHGDMINSSRTYYDFVYCPKCGKIIGRIGRGTLISLTTYNNIHDKYMEERSNDIKYEF
jgi:predicted RNA-binding Zn-ribbon protein involved in translation (DUF1610 family)